jgi:uncharacterized protein with von Willebrand factor type A (vWA) domain
MPSKAIQQKLEEEYQRFIEFGQLLDRQTRKYLVQYLQNLLGYAGFSIPEELHDQYFLYFKQALDQLFTTQQLIPILQKNDTITQQLVLDTLYWIRKTYDKVRQDNPYDDEVKRLSMWSITPKHIFVTRWAVMTEYLKAVYPKDQLDIFFYQENFQQIIGSKPLSQIPPKEQDRMEMILTDLLAQWDALLNAKILEHQLHKLAEEREQYLELIEAKVQEYQQLMDIITPFSDYLGWDMSRALWQESSFDIIQQYNELLQDEKSLQELADLLGQLREAEIEMEEETFEKTIIRQEWITDEQAKAEIVGIHESDDLSNLLSSEAGLLSDEATEDLFLQKFAEKNLMTFRYEDRQLVKSEDKFTEVNQRIKQKEKGPFIVCIDTSESMTGRPEQIAKVLSLGILKMAIRENRRAYLINFSTGIKTLDLYDIANSVDELAKFLKMSFYGGTDISLPLYEAIRQLKSNDYQDADILVISDFIMYRVDKDVLREVLFFQQNKDTQFHSLTLSDDPSTQILEAFDNNWLYDPKKKGIIRDLNRDVLRDFASQ